MKYNQWLLILLCSLVGLISTSPLQAQEETVLNERFGLRFTVPPGWQLSVNPGVVDLLNPNELLETGEGEIPAGISVRMYANPHRERLAVVAQKLHHQMTINNGPQTPVGLSPVTGVENPAIEELVSVSGLPANTGPFYLVAHQERVYGFHLNLGQAESAPYEQTLHAVLNSLSFEPATWAGYSLEIEQATEFIWREFADQFDYPVGKPKGAGWRIIQDFGKWRYNNYHAAEDWAQTGGRTAGQPVYAVASGLVVYATAATYPGDVVIVEHLLPDGELWYSMYGHLGGYEVKRGQLVNRGDSLGIIYNWGGNSHLHFEIRDFLTQETVNGSAAASGRHYNYPPGPGYWPMGRFRSTDEMPLDRGWIKPEFFISLKQPRPVSNAPLYGWVFLQGRTDHLGSRVFVSEQPCTARETIVSVDDRRLIRPAAVTNARGYFEIPDEDKTYQCLWVTQPNYLEGQHAGPLHGNLGSLTLEAGDLNGDSEINQLDMQRLQADMARQGTASDLNNDGRVNILDISLLSLNFQSRGPLTGW